MNASTLKGHLSPNLRGILSTLIIFFSTGAYMPFVNLAFDNRGISESQIGMLGALPGILVILVTPFVSRLADQRRMRLIFAGVGFMVAAIFIGLQMVPLGFWWLLIMQLCIAVVNGPLSPITSAVMVRMARKYDIEYGNWRLWGSFAFASAAFLMGLFWQQVGIQWLFLGAWILTTLAGLSIFLLEEPEPDTTVKVVLPGNNAVNWLPKQAVVWLFLLAAFFANAGMVSFNQYSAIYMIRLGGAASLAGLMRTASALVEIPTMYFASKLEKKIGALGVFFISVVVFAIAWFLFSVATEPWMLIAITAFRGIGFGFATVSAVVFLDSKARVSEAASYQSLYSSLVFGVAPLLAGPLFGFIAERQGMPIMYRIASLVGSLGIVFMLAAFYANRHEKPIIAA